MYRRIQTVTSNVVTDDDGSCTYPEGVYDCDGVTCLNDVDGDGVCDEGFKNFGCMTGQHVIIIHQQLTMMAHAITQLQTLIVMGTVLLT